MRDSSPPKKKVEAELAEASAGRKWNEPGSIRAPEPPVDSGRIQLTELGSDDGQRHQGVLKSSMPDSELERSLMGLEMLAEEAKAEVALRRSSSPPPHTVQQAQQQQGEWLWYAAALFIVGVAVLAYLWI